MDDTATQQRRVFFLAVPAASVVATLLGVELALRVFLPQPHSIEANAYFVADERLGFRMMPESTGSYFDRVPLVVNAHGHRDDWVPRRKPAGVRRILVLGDSFTVGAGVPQDDAYPQVLERELQDRFPGLEVVNAGTGGWGPYQYAEYLDAHGMGFEPDLVLVGFYVGNDAYDEVGAAEELTLTAVAGRRVQRSELSNPWLGLKVFLYEHSHLARLYFRRQAGQTSLLDHPRYEASICDELAEPLPHPSKFLRWHRHATLRNTQRMEKSLRQLERIEATAASAGARVVVVLIPTMIQVSPLVQAKAVSAEHRDSLDWEMPQKALRRELTARGILVIDLLGMLAGRECLYANNRHLVPEGQRLVGRTLATFLHSNPELVAGD